MNDVAVDALGARPTRLSVAVWLGVGIATLITAVAIAFAVIQFQQLGHGPETQAIPPPANVSVAEFLKQLSPSTEPVATKSANQEDVRTARVGLASIYRNAAQQIVACSRELNARSGLDTSAFTPQLAESFGYELQRVGNSQSEYRGAAYVADAVRFFCAAMQQQDVIAYKRNNSEEKLVDAAINYHLVQWDQLQRDTRRNQQDESLRRMRAAVSQELSIAKVQLSALVALCLTVEWVGITIGGMMLLAQIRMGTCVLAMQKRLDDMELSSRTPATVIPRLPLTTPESAPPSEPGPVNPRE